MYPNCPVERVSIILRKRNTKQLDKKRQFQPSQIVVKQLFILKITTVFQLKNE